MIIIFVSAHSPKMRVGYRFKYRFRQITEILNSVIQRFVIHHQSIRFFDEAIDIVKEGSKLFMYSKDGANGAKLKYSINETTGCPVL